MTRSEHVICHHYLKSFGISVSLAEVVSHTSKASLKVSKVKVGKKAKLSDEDDCHDSASMTPVETESPVKGGRKKAKARRNVAAAGKEKQKRTKSKQ